MGRKCTARHEKIQTEVKKKAYELGIELATANLRKNIAIERSPTLIKW